MKTSRMKLQGLSAGLGLALLACAAPALAQDKEQEGVIEAIRVATERFRDVNVALEEGYIADPSGYAPPPKWKDFLRNPERWASTISARTCSASR